MRPFQTFLNFNLLTGCLLFASLVIAADLERENMLAEAVINSTAKIEPQWLETKNGRFLSLFNHNVTGTLQGGVIILPPLGGHPNWQGAVHHLRTSLPHYGWATLAIQMPVLNSRSTLNDYAGTLSEATDRIDAALAFMHSKGIRYISLIGNGLGAAAGAAYLAAKQTPDIQTFIGISMSGYTEVGGWLYSPNSISKLSLPTLDLYGNRDHYHVSNSAEARALAASQATMRIPENSKQALSARPDTNATVAIRHSANIPFRSTKITGADSSYSGQENQLLKNIVGWLRQYAKGISGT
jgi:hypothetical protein